MYKIVVVDDEDRNLENARQCLDKYFQMHVTCLKSGRQLLEFLKTNKPDLILLDIMMPDFDGFQTMEALNEQTASEEERIPVIFLTADDNPRSEKRGLELGAMDFIKKPYAWQVFECRIRHTLELVRLQKNLAAEVERRVRENESLAMHVVQSLAEAIDAKDAYTKGHSGRVACYAKEIAKRCGYTEEQQNAIYMMGLLHDVGKIGVPDAVLNKEGRLTEEELTDIKKHPVIGSRILDKIREMPQLSIGALGHHERYDGTGYPDGCAGKDILEEARIIAVADAYDAMTSRRSYRDGLAQDAVRREIEQGRGTQFDPRFADIMLQMMAEDTAYQMKPSKPFDPNVADKMLHDTCAGEGVLESPDDPMMS